MRSRSCSKVSARTVGVERLRCGRGGSQMRPQLVEIQLHEAERRRLVKHGEAQQDPSPRFRRCEEQLPRRTRMVQPTERPPLQLTTELAARRMDRRRQRAGGHDVDRPREAMLRQDLAARRQYEGQQHVCILDELP